MCSFVFRKRTVFTKIRQNFSHISEFANKKTEHITLQELIKLGVPPLTEEKLLSSAQFCLKELPIRLSKRVQSFQNLPYIVSINPHLLNIQELYLDSFIKLKDRPLTKDSSSLKEFNEFLFELLSEHEGVIPKLARGFLECTEYLSEDEISNFIDNTIISRIGVRLLAEHNISLYFNRDKDYVGVINTKLPVRELVENVALKVSKISEVYFGRFPDLFVNGNVSSEIQYIPVHLEYMLTELLKNSYRATMEYTKNIQKDEYPPIEVTIADYKDSLTIRLRDKGGGIPYVQLKNIFKYSFTTAKNEDTGSEGLMNFQSDMERSIGGPIGTLNNFSWLGLW